MAPKAGRKPNSNKAATGAPKRSASPPIYEEKVEAVAAPAVEVVPEPRQAPAAAPVAQLKEALEARESNERTPLLSKLEETRLQQLTKYVKQPEFRKYAVATSGGVVVFGSAGGAFGAASGIVIGSLAGAVPALLTFGLSIPIGAAIGGTFGGAIGGTVGAVSGGAGTAGICKYRVEIQDGLILFRQKVNSTSAKALDVTKEKTDVAITFTRDSFGKAKAVVKSRTQAAVDQTKTKGTEILLFTREKADSALVLTKAKAGSAREYVTSTQGKVTLGSAAAGGVMGGATGGAVGLATGAAVGVVPALFTFGLSIPVCAAVGLCVGSSAGGVAGTVAGGAAGAYRVEIKEGAHTALAKARNTADDISAASLNRFEALKAGAQNSWARAQNSTANLKLASYDKINQFGDTVKAYVGTGGTGSTA